MPVHFDPNATEWCDDVKEKKIAEARTLLEKDLNRSVVDDIRKLLEEARGTSNSTTRAHADAALVSLYAKVLETQKLSPEDYKKNIFLLLDSVVSAFQVGIFACNCSVQWCCEVLDVGRKALREALETHVDVSASLFARLRASIDSKSVPFTVRLAFVFEIATYISSELNRIDVSDATAASLITRRRHQLEKYLEQGRRLHKALGEDKWFTGVGRGSGGPSSNGPCSSNILHEWTESVEDFEKQLAECSGLLALREGMDKMRQTSVRSRTAMDNFGEAQKVFHNTGNRKREAEAEAYLGMALDVLRLYPLATTHYKKSLSIVENDASVHTADWYVTARDHIEDLSYKTSTSHDDIGNQHAFLYIHRDELEEVKRHNASASALCSFLEKKYLKYKKSNSAAIKDRLELLTLHFGRTSGLDEARLVLHNEIQIIINDRANAEAKNQKA